MIFVGGISGAGKTTIVNRFVSEHPNYIHVRASSVLRMYGRDLKNIVVEEFVENQIIIANYLLTLRNEKVIVDGHSIIPYHGGVYIVPLDFFKALNVKALILIKADPITVSLRKGMAPRPETIKNIKNLQNAEKRWLTFIASQIQKPLFITNSYDLFKAALLKL